MKFKLYMHPNTLRDDDPLLATLEDYGFATFKRQRYAQHGIYGHVVVDADNPPTIEVETLDDLARMQDRVQMPIEIDFERNTLTLVGQTEDY